MNIVSSNAADLPLPEWAYMPGQTTGAEPDYDTLSLAKALVPARFRGFVPARHPALRYGITLNDAGYFWEAQQVLEAVWAAAPQGGRERILFPRLHSGRQRQSQTADAKTPGGGTAMG